MTTLESAMREILYERASDWLGERSSAQERGSLTALLYDAWRDGWIANRDHTRTILGDEAFVKAGLG